MRWASPSLAPVSRWNRASGKRKQHIPTHICETEPWAAIARISPYNLLEIDPILQDRKLP